MVYVLRSQSCVLGPRDMLRSRACALEFVLGRNGHWPLFFAVSYGDDDLTQLMF